MEAEIVKDKKKAELCECLHSAARHELEGVGHCEACACSGFVAADVDSAAVDEGGAAIP